MSRTLHSPILPRPPHSLCAALHREMPEKKNKNEILMEATFSLISFENMWSVLGALPCVYLHKRGILGWVQCFSKPSPSHFHSTATARHIKESQNSLITFRDGDTSSGQLRDNFQDGESSMDPWNLLKFFISHSLGARVELESLILSFAYNVIHSRCLHGQIITQNSLEYSRASMHLHTDLSRNADSFFRMHRASERSKIGKLS